MANKKTTVVTTVVNGNQTIQKTVVSGDAPDKANYFSENFFKTIAVALTGIGLLGIYAYHYNVKYYPVFDIKSAASLVFAAAYTGLILICLLSVMVCGPWLLVSMLMYDRIKGANKKKLPGILIPYWSVAFFSFLLITCELGFGAHGWLAGIGGLALVAFVCRYAAKNPWPGSRVFEQGLSIALMGCLQLVPVFLFITFLAQSQTDLPNNARGRLDFFGIVAFVDMLVQLSGAYVVTAWLTGTLGARHKSLSLLSVGVVVIIVTVVTNRSDFMGTQIANITKFGNFYAAEMTLSKDGCKAINSDGDTVCTGSEEKGFKVCGVYIVSRIGAESYLRIFDDKVALPADPKHVQKALSFTKAAYVPSKEVLGLRLYDQTGPEADLKFLHQLSACSKKVHKTGSTEIRLSGKEFFELDKAELGATGRSCWPRSRTNYAHARTRSGRQPWLATRTSSASPTTTTIYPANVPTSWPIS